MYINPNIIKIIKENQNLNLNIKKNQNITKIMKMDQNMMMNPNLKNLKNQEQNMKKK